MIDERLRELGIELPPAVRPLASYRPALVAASFLYVSGQLPVREGRLLHTGRVGAEVSLEAAQEAARQCALNALAAARDCLGTLDRVEQVVRVSAYVASAHDFYQQPLVVNGASDLLAAVFGERGRHSRIAVGVAALPLNAPVEVDLICLIQAR
jgi:enamine deaminase RidA (YjgF/YER057c/UK114 family)